MLNVYSVLFANSNVVYVRVTSVVKSLSDVSEPVHGASVTLSGTEPGMPVQGIELADTTAVVDGDTASFYYAPVHIVPGGYYLISVSKEKYLYRGCICCGSVWLCHDTRSGHIFSAEAPK